jgi:hypothetical protein
MFGSIEEAMLKFLEGETDFDVVYELDEFLNEDEDTKPGIEWPTLIMGKEELERLLKI